MNAGWTKFWATVICAVAFTLAGCEGDDGDDGKDGEPGTAGVDGVACWDLNENGVGDFDLPEIDPPGTEDINGDGTIDVLDCNAATIPPPGGGTPVAAVETCAVCHGDGSIGDAAAAHALPPIESVSNIAFAVNGADLDVTFDLAADGAPAEGYDVVERGYRTEGTVRTTIVDSATLTDNGGGNYTIKVLGGAAEAAINNRYLFRVAVAADTARETPVYFYGDFPASPFDGPVVVTAQSCTNCHGPEGIDVHGGYFAATDGGEPCLECHGVQTPDRETGELVLRASLVEVTHAYHSSMWEEDGEFVEVTYPSYMNNCSVCHDTEEFLTAANSMPVNDQACFSCHGSTETMFAPDDPLYTGLHAGLDSGCETCHVSGGVAGNVLVVTDTHNGSTTERGGIIWNGIDTSVTEGAKILWEITGVADDGTNLSITWQASYDGASVDPCNATAGAGAPVFFGDGEGNLSILRNYAQGEDYILGTNPDRAGQPGGTPGVSAENTTCAGNVATTVVPVEETEAMYGRVAIQGKPRVVSIDPEDADGLMAVRAFTPTYDWVIGTANAAPERRAVVDSSLCLNCHVGSMYQHGGNRVDNMDMCYLCHNTAANDAYVRVNGFGVDASEAYDGRSGQNFGLREMLHAVHSAGGTGAPIVIYRGRGIYAWAGDESLLSNWPTEDDCVRGNGSPGRTVFGSDDAPPAEEGGADPCQPHTFHTPTYPRGLYDCAACHVDTLKIFPDATKSMASTVETGEPPFGDQLNDVLEGTQTSSCMTCHRSDDPAMEAALKSHAYQNGWTPQAFPEGRQSIIEANQ